MCGFPKMKGVPLNSCVIFSIIVIKGIFSYCPPLTAPETTFLKCEEPTRHQILNCSTSWLSKDTVAQFKCKNNFGKRVKGKVLCIEDGKHFHITRSGNSSVLPCGIRKLTEKPEIHIYGYQAPVHYPLRRDKNTTEDFRVFGVRLHNEFRSMHGSPPLQLEENLSSSAQKWANHVSSQGRLDMAPEMLYGQNIFLAQTSNIISAVNDAIQNWYYEGRSQYSWEDISRNWHSSLALDFSQVVWKDSKIFGLGAVEMKTKKNSGIVVVAFYHPSGNTVFDDEDEKSENAFKSNVPNLQIL